jgi:two-component system, cell cycle response regulator
LSKKRSTDKTKRKDSKKSHEVGKTKLLSLETFSEDTSRIPVLVVVSGNLLDVGKVLPLYRNNLTVGRDSSTDLPLNDRLISRNHLEVAEVKQEKDAFSIHVKDNGSTNGTFLKGKRINEEWLRSGETIEIGTETILLFRTESINCIKNPNIILSMISKDSLTGVYNRRAFDQLIEHIREKLSNTGVCYSLLLIDIDHFKKVNDSFGHPFGDSILKMIAETICMYVRAEDIVARLGGDEFAVVLPGLNAERATELSERLMSKIRCLKSDDQKCLDLTVSIGISDDCSAKLKPSELYRRADVALYKAKKKGRNTSCAYQADIAAF